MENDLFEWVELILAAVLQKRDAQPLVDLALRAGVDLDVLEYFLNVTLDSVRDHLMSAAAIVGWLARGDVGGTNRSLSPDDLAALEDLGIDPE